MTSFLHARNIMATAIAARAFPAAVVEVGTRETVLWSEAFGYFTYDEGAPPTGETTVFDLASLTKVIATTAVAMRLVDVGQLGLTDRVSKWIPEWRGLDREEVTVEDLLTHASGLTSYLPFFRDHSGRTEFQQAICALPLEYRPRARSIYSDLGFILLGFVIENAGGSRLADQFAPIAALLRPDPVLFTPPRAWRNRIAPTEVDPWRGHLLVGEVHDENAWALGGVAGHAGLFGTAAGAGRFARLVLGAFEGDPLLVSQRTVVRFSQRRLIPGSSRALGWDTMLPTSSCGTRMSPKAIGHTGFTGTSLWIDPLSGVYVVLLTNRVHPDRSNDAILQVRRDVHDAVMDAVRPRSVDTPGVEAGSA
ncbi:MAG: serine hydrolase [Acidobacteria bacterium]|nr:serine hydrolase [Acidobacteriota bacterium]